MKRGEIRWYKFNHPDKKRPVILLTRDSAIELINEITVAPISSTVRNIPSEVMLTTEDGMRGDCVIQTDHLHTVPKGRLGTLITTLEPRRFDEVRTALLAALGFRN